MGRGLWSAAGKCLRFRVRVDSVAFASAFRRGISQHGFSSAQEPPRFDIGAMKMVTIALTVVVVIILMMNKTRSKGQYEGHASCQKSSGNNGLGFVGAPSQNQGPRDHGDYKGIDYAGPNGGLSGDCFVPS